MPKRIAIIRRDKCQPLKCSGTYWCKGACPVNRKGDDCISKGPDTKVLINEDTCIGCGICVSCPFDAISIINLPEEFSYEPIHRYGPNMFSLYNLPAPKNFQLNPFLCLKAPTKDVRALYFGL